MVSELLAPDGAGFEQVAGALSGALPVRERVARTVDRSFYDSVDARVRAAGLMVVHEDGHLVVAERKSGQVRGRHPMRRPRSPMLAASLPDGELRTVLAPVMGPRALLAVARVQARRRSLDVLDGESKTVVRGLLAAPTALGPGASADLRPRLLLTAVRGYDGELRRVRGLLERELGFSEAATTLADEAAQAGGWPLGAGPRVSIELASGMAADAAASAVLTAQVSLVEANLPGAIDDIDTEFLHDLRVAVRRSRAVLRELRGVYDPDTRAHFATELRWLQQVTGPVRDLDIHLLEFDDYRGMVAPEFAAALAPVQAVLASRRRRAFLGLRRVLRSERLQRLLGEWRAMLEALPEGSAAGRPDARRPAEAVVGPQIDRLYRRMVKRGSAIGDDSPAAELHELRKQGKELRYLLELFGGLYPAEVVRPLVRSLKDLQDVLGRYQDRDVQRLMLRTVREEVAAQPEGVAALVASGALAQRLCDDELTVRQEVPGRFAGFASRGRRRAVKETFR